MAENLSPEERARSLRPCPCDDPDERGRSYRDKDGLCGLCRHERTKLAAEIREAVEAERLAGMKRTEEVAAPLREAIIRLTREVEAEREACAKLCETQGMLRASPAARLCAEKIRARGKENS